MCVCVCVCVCVPVTSCRSWSPCLSPVASVCSLTPESSAELLQTPDWDTKIQLIWLSSEPVLSFYNLLYKHQLKLLLSEICLQATIRRPTAFSSPEVVLRAGREAGEGAVAMTTGEEGLNLREAELSAHLTGHYGSGGVLSAEEWKS